MPCMFNHMTRRRSARIGAAAQIHKKNTEIPRTRGGHASMGHRSGVPQIRQRECGWLDMPRSPPRKERGPNDVMRNSYVDAVVYNE